MSDTPDPTASRSIEVRQARPDDVAMIHALLRPFVMQHLLLSRTHAELVELTRHGFVALDQPVTDNDPPTSLCVGFCAVEVYSPKLAELQSLAVHPDYQRTGLGKRLVMQCVERARDLGIMEILAISSSDRFLETCGFQYSLPDQKRALFHQLRPRPYEDR